MAEHQTLIGFLLFVGGLLTAYFNEPLARLSGKIGRVTGTAFSGEEQNGLRRAMNIVGGLLCAGGGLLLTLGITHIK